MTFDHPPRQTRSLKTAERMLAAAEAILKEGGLSGLSIAEVVRRAESSVGAFYGRFKDKDGLLRALHTRRLQVVTRRLEEMSASGVIAAMDRPDAVALCMTEMTRHYREQTNLMAAFVSRCAADPAGWADTVAVHLHMVRILAGLLAQSDGESDHERPDAALEFGLHMAFAYLGERAVHASLAGGTPFDDDELPVELSRMLLAYWTGRAS